MELEAFVYCWTDHKTNKLYIGSHKGSPDDGYVCSSKYMMEQYKERPDDFTRDILAEGLLVDMRTLEAKILDCVDARKNPNYYNMHNGNGDFYNKGHTKESKRKMSKSHTGKKLTEEHKRKIRKSSGVGVPRTKEIREKISKGQIGKILTTSTKQKLSIAHTGKKLTEEHKRKISETNKKMVFTEAHKLKISLAKMGHKQSNETKQKISITKKNANKNKNLCNHK